MFNIYDVMSTGSLEDIVALKMSAPASQTFTHRDSHLHTQMHTKETTSFSPVAIDSSVSFGSQS